MNTLTQTQPEPETGPQDQPVPQQDTDLQTIVEHLGSRSASPQSDRDGSAATSTLVPVRCSPTGRLAETFVLRVTSTGIEKLSDHQPRSNRTRPW